ncbi:MAG: hydroxymethylbilane synthase [Alphaproteobacteria bacterium]|nr:hydroxymethylbilane synthase [Alphaproteobacteria bacterium]
MVWKLALGTRSSLLALAQASLAKQEIEEEGRTHSLEGIIVEIKKYTTSGDRLFDARLESFGGKGLFIKEIEAALLNKEVDVAIHSVKDLPVQITPGLVFAAFLEREDPRDVLITRGGEGLSALKNGALIGTSSLRRKVQMLRLRKDLEIVHFRGNVDTRLKKLEEGLVDATLLAAAGLKRLHRWSEHFIILDDSVMLPAVGQGALVLQCREEDTELHAFLRRLNHQETEEAVLCERSFSAHVFGSCNTPVAGYAKLTDSGQLHLQGLIATLDGSEIKEGEIKGAPSDAESLGQTLGLSLKPFIETWRQCGSL